MRNQQQPTRRKPCSPLVNGQLAAFQIDVNDLGEPGINDTFRIRWSGSAAGGLLSGGNIQIK